MSKREKFYILRRPIITEKSLKLVDELNQYTFEVDTRSTKYDVKKAVEKKFKVTVEGVRVISMRGKRVIFGKRRIKGSCKNRKKALVFLKDSDSIDLFKVK